MANKTENCTAMQKYQNGHDKFFILYQQALIVLNKFLTPFCIITLTENVACLSIILWLLHKRKLSTKCYFFVSNLLLCNSFNESCFLLLLPYMQANNYSLASQDATLYFVSILADYSDQMVVSAFFSLVISLFIAVFMPLHYRTLTNAKRWLIVIIMHALFTAWFIPMHIGERYTKDDKASAKEEIAYEAAFLFCDCSLSRLWSIHKTFVLLTVR